MNYTSVKFEVNPIQPLREILVTMLAEIGFESFQDLETGVEAFIPSPDFSKDSLETTVKDLLHIGSISFSIEEIPQKNWNAVWESEYETVEVDTRCVVKAPFHDIPKDKFDFQIIIKPKMSFGTGHHATTFLMLSYLLDEKVANKDVLDMGSGTGVLAILAAQMKAKSVRAIDIEDWAFENAIENAALNNTEIDVDKGDSALIKGTKYDLILANINKNVLIADMEIYQNTLVDDGVLFLSGFFETDIVELEAHGETVGLKMVEKRVKNNWASLKMIKKEY